MNRQTKIAATVLADGLQRLLYKVPKVRDMTTDEIAESWVADLRDAVNTRAAASLVHWSRNSHAFVVGDADE